MNEQPRIDEAMDFRLEDSCAAKYCYYCAIWEFIKQAIQEYEEIGNIHDNPELLRASNDRKRSIKGFIGRCTAD